MSVYKYLYDLNEKKELRYNIVKGFFGVVPIVLESSYTEICACCFRESYKIYNPDNMQESFEFKILRSE